MNEYPVPYVVCGIIWISRENILYCCLHPRHLVELFHISMFFYKKYLPMNSASVSNACKTFSALLLTS